MQQANLMKLWPSCPDSNCLYFFLCAPSSPSFFLLRLFLTPTERLSFFLSASLSLSPSPSSPLFLSFFLSSLLSFPLSIPRGREAPRIFPLPRTQCATQAVCVFVSLSPSLGLSTSPSSSTAVHAAHACTARHEEPFSLTLFLFLSPWSGHWATILFLFSLLSLSLSLSLSSTEIVRLLAPSSI